ncbi:MAG: universal stress protein [Blastopirellula sp. JB062]
MKNLLVHLCNSSRTKIAIESAVELASLSKSKIRGVSILDTRQLTQKTALETSAYAGVEAVRLTLSRRRQQQACNEFVEACRRRNVPYEIDDVQGDPLELLVEEAKYSDLTIVSFRKHMHRHESGLSVQDLVELAQRSIQPLLVLRKPPSQLTRVLLIYDGSSSASRAIKTFMACASYLGKQFRLLCVGDAANPEGDAFRAMSQYCRSRIDSLEVGCLPGSPSRTAAKYATKWEADLLVLGISRPSTWLGIPFSHFGSGILRRTNYSVFAIS